MEEIEIELFENILPRSYLSFRCSLRNCHRIYDGRTWGIIPCECGEHLMLCPECLDLLRKSRDWILEHDTKESILVN